MNFILLSQDSGRIVGPVAKLLGVVMNGLFNALAAIGMPNIGIAIILFTIVINVFMLPLTINQQKNMKLGAVVNPEIQLVTAKYKGRRDQASMEAQQKETQAIYDKYGYSPTSGCLPMLVQLPVMFALYRVIWMIPGYVSAIKNQFEIIAQAALSQDGFVTKIAELATANGMSPEKYDFTGVGEVGTNHIIDLLYKFDSADWAQFKTIFPAITDAIQAPLEQISKMNNFLGLSLNEAPGYRISIALLIPVLAWFSQWLNIKVTSGSQPTNPDDPTAATMKSMNTFMPLFSAFICITLPCGLGLYWIASAAVRTVIQFIVNKRFESVDVKDLIAANIEKANVKRRKMGLPELNPDGSYAHGSFNADGTAKVSATTIAATKKTKNIQKAASVSVNASDLTDDGKVYEKGSIAARARMVRDFENKNKK